MATSKTPTLPSRSTLPMRNSGSSRFLRPIIGLLVLLIVAAASVATTWMITTRSQRSAANSAVQINVGQPQQATPAGATPTTFVAPPQTPQAVPAPIFIPITPFTVTLQSADRERLVHIAMTLRVSDEQSRQRIEKYMPEVRSRVLMLLSAQTPESVQSPQGKVDLANAVMKVVNRPFAPLPDGQFVTDVLFTEFVVQ
ncbi:flagellar basal body-associated FliL family protein [Bordetella genomosp. 11]|uniref:Flagellar protein FliL n=1 Tax=Bordetella genomosp. 11 TaxID=1416808 RepID=A0A261UGI4_9BORD|nr:flagellar basal body-associated FliL family protein [Bordetella genomosp. 11]OZI60320.1 flagellar basal body protein FliL [Bordetella genomosp. 11]